MTEGVIQRRRRILQNTPRQARAERLGPACGLRPAGEERASGAGWAEGRPGRKVGRAESKEKNFRIKIGFLNLARLWKFVEEDLGGILT
jgi:hypothetical protein